MSRGKQYSTRAISEARSGSLEARVGIEPTHKGFADLSLTTWVPRPCSIHQCSVRSPGCGARASWKQENLERETGFEPATSTLARSHSTTELLPLDLLILPYWYRPCQCLSLLALSKPVL